MLLLTPFFWALWVRFEEVHCLFSSVHPILCFHSVLYFKLWQTEMEEVFVLHFCSSFLIPRWVCVCMALHQHLFVWRIWNLFIKGFPIALSSFVHLWSIVCVAVAEQTVSQGRNKDAHLYSEWLAGSLILRNTVGMSHQSAWEDEIYIERAPLHSTVV